MHQSHIKPTSQMEIRELGGLVIAIYPSIGVKLTGLKETCFKTAIRRGDLFKADHPDGFEIENNDQEYIELYDMFLVLDDLDQEYVGTKEWYQQIQVEVLAKGTVTFLVAEINEVFLMNANGLIGRSNTGIEGIRTRGVKAKDLHKHPSYGYFYKIAGERHARQKIRTTKKTGNSKPNGEGTQKMHR